ncbi:MAG: ROK family glucokinase [Planctomycetes bacterium]|nr:ROK family glucokinase [Planctomycetota bacterium]
MGLDLGGTNVKAGVVDDRAKVLGKVSKPTHAEGGPDAVVRVMAEAAHEAVAAAGVKMENVERIGIGSPGPIDFDAAVVRATPNMPGWRDVPLRDRITSLTGRPAILENDANAAALGELWAGAGRGLKVTELVMLTLGTGVGSGIIVGGKIIHGAFAMGGESGHMIVVPGGRLCGCGQHGCLEAYTSASATGRRAVEALQSGASSSLARDFANRLDTITAKDVFDAARSGDALANRIVDETATYLGIACVNLCRILDPQMIVFAGGMILAGDMLFDRVRSAFRANTWTVVESKVEIVPALLGNDAGFIGAAAVARNGHRNGQA